MKKMLGLFFVCLSVFVLVSCQTTLNSGIAGAEHAALPPYQITEESQVDIAVSAQGGSTQTNGVFTENTSSNFLQGNAILQWQNLLSSNTLCGSISLSGWGGKIDDFSGESEKYMPSENDSRYYGGTAALRVGRRFGSGESRIYAPAVEILYSYEDGPYIDARRDLADIKIYGDDQFINLKPNHSTVMFSLIPLDLTFSLFRGEMRIVNSYGWNDQWLAECRRESDEVKWSRIQPFQYEFSMTFKPSFCDAYITMDFDFLRQMTADDSGLSTGFSIGLGYVFR